MEVAWKPDLRREERTKKELRKEAADLRAAAERLSALKDSVNVTVRNTSLSLSFFLLLLSNDSLLQALEEYLQCEQRLVALSELLQKKNDELGAPHSRTRERVGCNAMHFSRRPQRASSRPFRI